MLFVVASFYLIVKFIQVILWYIWNYSERSTLHYQYGLIGFNYSRILVTIYHSVNSIVYIVFFQEFRKAFSNLFWCKQNYTGNESHGDAQGNDPTNGQEMRVTDVGHVGCTQKW